MKFERWSVAYRRRNGDRTLLDDRDAPFTCIPNTWRYWAGDPHAVELNGRTYVFAELYDRLMRKGVIGCCELTQTGATPWQVVLKQPFHLSYPHILQYGDEIYMIPESYVGHEVSVYKAINFPKAWKKVNVLTADWVAVDSTVFSHSQNPWMITLRLEGGHEHLILVKLSSEGNFLEQHTISLDDPNKRPAGYLFQHGDRLIRPAQDCTESYGCALNFYEVNHISENCYAETLLAKLKPEDICTDLGSPAEGLHTYNMTANYEFVDLKEYETDIFFWITYPIWFIWRRVKKLLWR